MNNKRDPKKTYCPEVDCEGQPGCPCNATWVESVTQDMRDEGWQKDEAGLWFLDKEWKPRNLTFEDAIALRRLLNKMEQHSQ